MNIDLPQNDILLQSDHSIYNPLSDLKTYFPKATFYPILIGQKVTETDLIPIIKSIKDNCHWDCLLVASVDFSHYLPAALADIHDAYTIYNLSTLNHASLLSSEVDSPQSLYLLVNFAKVKNALKWTLSAHTNSGLISHNPDTETTTHVFGLYTRNFFIQPDYHLTSVSVPAVVERSQNLDTVGDRFFYGTDFFNVYPNQLNFVIATIESANNLTTKSYLPAVIDGQKITFLRGDVKSQIIKKYFDSIPDNNNLTKDYFWGKLTYDRNHFTPTPP